MQLKILVATPSINGNLTVNYMQSFLNTVASTRHVIGHYTNQRDGLVSLARNSAVHFALEHEFDKIFFIDADIAWTPEQFSLIANSAHPIIAGAYPYRSFPQSLVVNVLDKDKSVFGVGDLGAFKQFRSELLTPIIEVANIAAGFMCINTEVFRNMQRHVDSYTRLGKPGEAPTEQYDYFKVGIMEEPTGRKVYCTEDFGFCSQAKSLGYSVMWDTNVIVKHCGTHIFDFISE